MKQQLQVFKNKELDLNVRAIKNEDGSISINAEDTARGFGWCRVQTINGEEYSNIIWHRFHKFCEELGFAHKCAKDDYIPESLFYRLGMKANNEVANRFQDWLAIDVIPSIRKNGAYSVQPKMLTATEQLELQLQVMKEQNKKIEQVNQKVDNLQDNMPLFNVECKELQALVRKTGIKMLGGYRSPAYRDNSLRGKVYADIQGQLKREFGVARYEAIKRCQLSIAEKILDNYKLPAVLEDEIVKVNNQISFNKEVV